MLKLYRINAGKLHYWETWEKGRGTAVVHWGVAGERGEWIDVVSDAAGRCGAKIKAMIRERRAEGFAEIDMDDHRRLIIQYADGVPEVDDSGDAHPLANLLNEALGWTGLGNCDTAFGNGSFEVCCFVVDFRLGRSVVAKELKGSAFAGYAKIFDEELEMGL
jgi:hypothetical protein